MNSNTPKTPPLSLDVNGFYPIEARRSANGKGMDIVVDLSRATSPHLFRHLQEGLRLNADAWFRDAALQSEKAPETLLGIVSNGLKGSFELEGRARKIIPPQLPEDGAARLVRFHVSSEEWGRMQTIPFLLSMHGEKVAAFQATRYDGLVPVGKHAIYQMDVTETRALGMDLAPEALRKLPYSRAAREGFDSEKHSPITDLHTHASAELSGRDLVDIAVEVDTEAAAETEDVDAGIAFPVELLQKLGVPPEKGQNIIRAKSLFFSPTRSEGLECEKGGESAPGEANRCDAIRMKDLSSKQLHYLAEQSQIKGDQCMVFSSFDPEFYRFRNPLTKHPKMVEKSLRRMAEKFVREGIEYAELSTSSMMLSTGWLESMIETLNDIEEKGVTVTMPDGSEKTGHPKMRFLVALQRDLGPERMLNYIERVKYLMRHPYIVGVDLVGYEANKTKDFHWAFSHLADWAAYSEGTELRPEDGWDMKRDTILRIHAGETNKNPENVRDAMALADEYGVRVRVAHALNVDLEKDDVRTAKNLSNALETDLSREEMKNLSDEERNALLADRFAFELCAPSNQVFYTNTFPATAPFTQRKEMASSFLGSDGGDGLAVTPKQLAYAALAAGARLGDLEQMREMEKGYIKRQMVRDEKRFGAYRKLYGARVGAKGEAANSSSIDRAFIKGYEAHIATLPLPGDKHYDSNMLPSRFEGRTPLLVGGASGSSWERMTKSEQAAAKHTIAALIRTMDPEKHYLVLGRAKKEQEGVTKLVDEEVKRYNQANPTRRIQVLARFAGVGEIPNAELPLSASWVHHAGKQVSAIARDLVQFTQARGGQALFLGGGDFTHSMAKDCMDFGVPFEVLPVGGALKQFVQANQSAFTIDVKHNYADKAPDRKDFLTVLFQRWYNGATRGLNLFASLARFSEQEQIRFQARNQDKENIPDTPNAPKIPDPQVNPEALAEHIGVSQWHKPYGDMPRHSHVVTTTPAQGSTHFRN